MKRQRGRNRGGGGSQGGKPQHNANRAFDSNGPEGIKVRGAAQSVYEKYHQLARDAQTSGDRVLAENYLQHAEHYFRLLRTMQPQRPLSEIIGRDQFVSGYDIDFEDETGASDGADGEGPDSANGADTRPTDARAGDYRPDNRAADGRSGDGRAGDGRTGDNRPVEAGEDARRLETRTRDDRWRDDRRRDDRSREDRPREERTRDDRTLAERTPTDRTAQDRNREFRNRDERGREDRGQTERDRDGRPASDRFRADRPRTERAEGAAGSDGGDRGRSRSASSDPLGIIEPKATPLPIAGPSSGNPPGGSLLRADDGEVSHAPAFLTLRPPAPLAEEAASDADQRMQGGHGSEAADLGDSPGNSRAPRRRRSAAVADTADEV